MIRLNLLPDREKKAVRRLRVLILWQEILFIVFAFLVLNSALLITFRAFLERDLKDVLDTPLPGSKEIEILNEKVRSTNEWIAFHLNVLHPRYITWLEPLYGIAQAVPSAVTLTGLNANADGTITITGIARNRDELISLRNQLRELPFFKQVELPLQNLSASRNISFSMQILLNLDSLTVRP